MFRQPWFDLPGYLLSGVANRVTPGIRISKPAMKMGITGSALKKTAAANPWMRFVAARLYP